MSQTAAQTLEFDHDVLGAYIRGVSRYPEKLGAIAENQRQMASSLGRTAAMLRSIAALNSEFRNPVSGNLTPDSGKQPTL
jgi:HD-like signal output (HDOD) protein